VSHTEVTYVQATALHLPGEELRSVAELVSLDLAAAGEGLAALDRDEAVTQAIPDQDAVATRAGCYPVAAVDPRLAPARRPNHIPDAKPNGHGSATGRFHHRGHRHPEMAAAVQADLDPDRAAGRPKFREVVHRVRSDGSGNPALLTGMEAVREMAAAVLAILDPVGAVVPA